MKHDTLKLNLIGYVWTDEYLDNEYIFFGTNIIVAKHPKKDMLIRNIKNGNYFFASYDFIEHPDSLEVKFMDTSLTVIAYREDALNPKMDVKTITGERTITGTLIPSHK